ncbi:DNA methyltransferase [Mycoplasma sp. 394]
MDPPYNTERSASDGNNVADDTENKKNKTLIYRDKYTRNGWLNMMNERFRMARELLKDDGVIFVSIDDNQQAYLKILMDEIFGENNFVASCIWVNNFGGRSDKNNVASCHEYIHIYAKNIDNLSFKKVGIQENTNKWKFNEKLNLYEKELYPLQKGGGAETLNERPNMGYIIWWNKETNEFIIDNDGIKNKVSDKTSSSDFNFIYDFDTPKRKTLLESGFIHITPAIKKNKNKLGRWRVGLDKVQLLIKENKLKVKTTKDSNIVYEYEHSEFIPNKSYQKFKSVIANFSFNELLDDLYWDKSIFSSIDSSGGTTEFTNIIKPADGMFNNPKPVNIIKLLINLHPNINLRILDFYAGSGTTGHATLQLNREDGGNRTFTLVTNNENSIGRDINYERLRRINTRTNLNKNEYNLTWYKNNDPYNSNLNVYWLDNDDYIDISLFSNITVKEIEEKWKNLIKNFGVQETNFDKDDLLTELLTLKPLIKDGKN